MGLLNIYRTVASTFILSAIAVTSKEQLSSRECEDMGFTGLAVCSDCNTSAKYVKEQGNPFCPLTFCNQNVEQKKQIYDKLFFEVYGPCEWICVLE